MCRFVMYLGAEEITVSSLVTEPVNSIINQSFQSSESKEPLNGDGFGLAWYVPGISPQPALYRDVTPAWNNLNLLNLARVTRSCCVLAHVRAATPGLPIIQLNCHPFVWGPFSFMHNGRIEGYRQIRRRLLGRLSADAFNLICGSTDSEHIFALFVDHFLRLDGEGPRWHVIARSLEGAIRDVEELTAEAGIEAPSLLNLAVTDGRSAAASRYISHDLEKANSLYVHRGSRYVCEGGVCRMIGSGDSKGAVMIASEPLSGDEGWSRVEPNTMVLVDEERELHTRSLEFRTGRRPAEIR